MLARGRIASSAERRDGKIEWENIVELRCIPPTLDEDGVSKKDISPKPMNAS